MELESAAGCLAISVGRGGSALQPESDGVRGAAAEWLFRTARGLSQKVNGLKAEAVSQHACWKNVTFLAPAVSHKSVSKHPSTGSIKLAAEHRPGKGKDMAINQISEALQHLRSAALLPDGAGLTDAQLLEGFLSRRDEAALVALVVRHAPMVWGVCRRVLRNDHDAEDAFQATFLSFVRRAATMAFRERLANWLYGVAYQTARKARATAARRRARERQVPEMPEPAVAPRDLAHDLRSLLDQELSRLPDKYRAPIVLFDLEGRTRKEVAQQLSCPEGTVAGRLARARGMLARRLARHGLVLSSGSLAAALAAEVASASVPTSVLYSTIKAASLFAAGPTAATGVISAKVAALTKGVLTTMLLTKLKKAAVVLLVVVVLGAGLTGLATAGLLSGAQPVPGTPDRTEPKAPKNVLEALQGDWQVAKLDIEPGEIREQFEQLGKFRVKGDKATVLFDLAGLGLEKETITWAEFTIKVDPSKSPATIDLRIDKTIEIQGLQPKLGATVPGIYKLEGDALKIFIGEDENDRPKAFPEKEKQGVLTLKRVKKLKGEEEKPPEKPRPKKEEGVRPKADKNGFAIVGPTVKEGRVEFEFTYEKNVEGIARFVVKDSEGKPLWILLGGGQNGLRKISYAV